MNVFVGDCICRCDWVLKSILDGHRHVWHEFQTAYHSLS